MPENTPIQSFDRSPVLPSLSQKLCHPDQLAIGLASLARPLVFTNGVFDVLHRGHVMYLEQARALGASLIIALNTDASARRLGKGPDRPLNNEMDRACVIAALASASLVTWFDEDTPLQLIERVRPDILVKGGDYDMDKLAETALVKSWGGRALALPFVTGYSTTALVRKIRQSDLSGKATGDIA
ncbi:MAG: D-glycero-beta-D-manno-heptose 1-phosphate adenylyltransferase [Rhodoferax sp.]|uniref:D-glycero-beta-D-manno-heptose 1-phosphate adenylyltransferase n=1 Tax=Rhodoferax sp. TaxID=50421 RepID=UPI001B46484B|nr:D-glycero-beta-D-manno-heptose 1-phosphate adenylyltransferase [Rhodoferax sp.]MBP8285308.1 D-glycero-beta-D-manno-heptose 1-phosphate adenylyltransferase [Rhodoferax sp.]MBP9150428.1 D-glycero-beta-D-manno-heptose 1-phosphate adenylyltransferase [Rhodoferax sp.]MBP9734046.1 D-glycero-beta-D-manno-heptose 1-phosphate adenylyltransferase [Rhodoferax sp.]